jgi:hypothetical protein
MPSSNAVPSDATALIGVLMFGELKGGPAGRLAVPT